MMKKLLFELKHKKFLFSQLTHKSAIFNTFMEFELKNHDSVTLR